MEMLTTGTDKQWRYNQKSIMEIARCGRLTNVIGNDIVQREMDAEYYGGLAPINKLSDNVSQVFQKSDNAKVSDILKKMVRSRDSQDLN